MGFLDQFEKLKKNLPRLPRDSLSNENSPYVNSIHVIKNCYYCFDGGLAEDSAYCYFPYQIKDCFDCDFTFESELCYQCVDCQKCYDCGFCQDCLLCRNLRFCFFCRNCHDCFGCVGLHHKSYCIFNKQYSKREYFNKIIEIKKRSIKEHKEKLARLSKKYPRQRIYSIKSENVPFGNHITNCGDSYWIFDEIGDERCAYLYQSKFNKDCFDMDQAYKNELCYAGKTAFSYKSSHIDHSSYLRNCHYMFGCENCEECWGCVNLNKAKYCILNKQYSEEEYFQKVKEIKQELGWPKPNAS